MGNLCQKVEENPIARKRLPPDVKLLGEKGSHERIFENLEKSNIFRLYNIQDVIQLFLNKFPRGGEGVSETEYFIFIEKKLIKNVQISEWILNSDTILSKVKDFHQKYYGVFMKGFKSFYKGLTNEKYRQETLPVVCFLPLAFLYSNGRIDSKIELLFNMFANEDQNIVTSNDLHYFIFSAFALPAPILLFTLKTLGDENEEVQKELDNFDFTSIFDTYQVKDAIHSTEEYLKILFTPEKPSLNYDEFKALFSTSKDLQSIFSAPFVRKFLEIHNI